MKEVGRRFEKLEIYLPEVIISADAMVAGVEVFRQHILAKGEQSFPKTVLLGTIQGDVHDIGKNIVRIMLESNGFRVYDLGRDVPVLHFIDKVKELNPDIVGVSALMTTTMVYMPKLIEALKEERLREKVKVMVGGPRYYRNGPKRSEQMVMENRRWMRFEWPKVLLGFKVREKEIEDERSKEFF